MLYHLLFMSIVSEHKLLVSQKKFDLRKRMKLGEITAPSLWNLAVNTLDKNEVFL